MKKSVFYLILWWANISLWFAASAVAQPGSNDHTFTVGVGANGVVDDLLVLSDGSVIYSGGFSGINLTPSPYLVKLKSDGSIDDTFHFDAASTATARVTIVTNQGDSLLIIGISNVNSLWVYTLMRLTDKGVLDATFPQHVFDQNIDDVHVFEDGSIMVTGGFQTINGSTKYSAVLLDKNGTLIADDPFPSIGSYSIKPLRNGDYMIISRSFDNEYTWTQFLKINSSGTYYEGYMQNLRGNVNVVEELPNGIMLVGGDFDQVNGITMYCLVAIDADGNLVQDFTAGFESGCNVNDILYLHENHILVAGSFDSYNNQDYTGIVQIRSDASLVASFKTPADLNVVRRIERFGDDRAYVAGNFVTIDGTKQQYIARLIINTISTSSDDGTEYFPSTYSIAPNYPNPFNPTTTLQVDLPEASNVDVTVYDLTGRIVMQLPARSLQAGRHNITLDASWLSSGVYVYRVSTGRWAASGKMTLVK